MRSVKTVGVIGAGSLGVSVARLAVLGGYRVLLANSRDPETIESIAVALGPASRNVTADQAVADADIVVLSIPVGRYGGLDLPGLAGKLVLDTGNYYPDRDGVIEALHAQATTTSGYLQSLLPASRVVKVFNSISWPGLRGLSRLEGRAQTSVLPVASDDARARGEVLELLTSLGWAGHDAGALEQSWRFERGKPAYVSPYTHGGDPFDPQPVDEPRLRMLLGQAVRG